MLSDNGLGKRIKQLRRERHITAEAFAESVDISISFLREIERGNKKPALDNFVKIANALNVTADALLCDSVDMAKPAVLNRITQKMGTLSRNQLNMVEAIFDTMLDEFSKINDSLK